VASVQRTRNSASLPARPVDRSALIKRGYSKGLPQKEVKLRNEANFRGLYICFSKQDQSTLIRESTLGMKQPACLTE
jgi:hypothetical protein